MIDPLHCPLRYVDLRCGDTSEQISLDMARHLPNRLSAGAVVILVDHPSRFLPALRKRWMHVIREVERQRASTLDHDRKLAMEQELSLMRTLRFGSAPCTRSVDVLLVSNPDMVPTDFPGLTLYATCGTGRDCLLRLLRTLPRLELLVLYVRSGSLPQHSPDGIQSDTLVQLVEDLV